MIRLTRLPCPRPLTEHGENWTRDFVDSGRKRPRNNRYAHPEVVETLRAMSHHKCFFCERKLGDGDQTVEHHVDVAEDRSQAFEWTNLYLACRACQNKLSEDILPRRRCLDPCDPDPKRDPADHLDFHEEVIQWQSERGHATVRKYKLDAPDRELRRLKLLKPMLKQLAGLQERLKLQNRGPDAQECRILWRLAHPSQPYSLMFRKLLEQAGIPPA